MSPEHTTHENGERLARIETTVDHLSLQMGGHMDDDRIALKELQQAIREQQQLIQDLTYSIKQLLITVTAQAEAMKAADKRIDVLEQIKTKGLVWIGTLTALVILFQPPVIRDAIIAVAKALLG